MNLSNGKIQDKFYLQFRYLPRKYTLTNIEKFYKSNRSQANDVINIIRGHSTISTD